MKILFIASRFPYPPLQGDRARAFHQLRLLAQRHQITLITPAPDNHAAENLPAIQPLCQHIELITVPAWQRLMRLSYAPFNNLPLQTQYFFHPQLQQKTQTLLQRHTFDLIHVQLARLGPLSQTIEALPTVLDLIDALSLNMHRRSQQEHWPLSWLIAMEANRMQRYERALTQQYRQLVVSSPLDKATIGNYANLQVIPNGVDIDTYNFVTEGRATTDIVFTGRMGYFPNANAAVWFATEVFPLIRQQVPQARFLIVGTDPTATIRALAKQPNIVVTGYVSHVETYLQQAAVAVAPMQAGSGMQFKVIEAMACGTPVVATPYALGGIDVIDGEHLLVASAATDFANQVILLLNDAVLAHKLALNGRQLVEEKYTWSQTVAQLEQVYLLAQS